MYLSVFCAEMVLAMQNVKQLKISVPVVLIVISMVMLKINMWNKIGFKKINKLSSNL